LKNSLSSIRVRNLSFKYSHEKIIFNNVSFLISPGEKVAIMGQNGSGKSTLCRLFTKQIDDYQGDIFIPENVKIAYAEQVMPQKYLRFSIKEYLLSAKGLAGVLHKYFLLLDLFALDKSLEDVKKIDFKANSLDELLRKFDDFNKSWKLPELQVSEENAVELMLKLEDGESDLNKDSLNQALKFLKACPDAETSLNLDAFLEGFKIYYTYLQEKTYLQNYAKKYFWKEMMDLLTVLQEEYENACGFELEDELRKVIELFGLEKLDDSMSLELLSGGQKARLLMAYAILQNPDILILDEPTNNLDQVSLARLTDYVKNFSKTLLVISHNHKFLEKFVDKVLYIDIFQQTVREFYGSYENCQRLIKEQIKKEKKEELRINKEIKVKKEIYAKRSQQAKIYDSAGLARTAKIMKKNIIKLEEQKKDILKEDRKILPFLISCNVIDDSLGAIDYINRWDGEKTEKISFNYQIGKSQMVLINGPNGCGKSYFLKECIAYLKAKNYEGTEVLPEKIMHNEEVLEVSDNFFKRIEKEVWFSSAAKIGYYSQDFTTLNFSHTVQASMEEIHPFKYQEMRSILAKFLFEENQLEQLVGDLSEGQKALLSWARLVFLQPNFLILDEPTNHLNFRHLPIIQNALKKYRGTVILVCHDREFVNELPIAKNLIL
jgi:ATP-binding cassette subfamily F protein 3